MRLGPSSNLRRDFLHGVIHTGGPAKIEQKPDSQSAGKWGDGKVVGNAPAGYAYADLVGMDDHPPSTNIMEPRFSHVSRIRCDWGPRCFDKGVLSKSERVI